MKKIIASFAAFSLILSVPSVIAQMPLGVPAAPAPSLASERIGVVAAAQGKVELTTPGQVGRIAQSGQVVYMGDEVTTDAQGQLQILLLDETVFTIGPNSSIIIDKFIYDPKTSAGEIRASIAKGVFRYVSGKIAAKNPDSVKIKLPTATLGFRGTIVGGSVESNGQGLVGLLGPGDNNDSGARVGSFTIDGDTGGQEEVNRSGFGVEVGADGGISNVFQLSDNQINGLTGGLGGGNQGGNGGGGNNQGGGGDQGLGGDTNMGNLSGENNALTGAIGAATGAFENFSDSLNNVSIIGAQDARTESGLNSACNANGITTTAELTSILSGSYDYSVVGADFHTTVSSGSPQPLPGVSGTFDASWTLNFDTKYLENVTVTITSPVSSGIGYNDPPYSTIVTALPGDVPFSDLSQNGNAVFVSADAGHFVEATITFQNVDGQIAQQGEIKVNYHEDNGGSPPVTIWEGNGSSTAVAQPV